MALPKIKLAIYKKPVMQLNKYLTFTSVSFSEIKVYFDVNTPLGVDLSTKNKKGHYKKIIDILKSLKVIQPVFKAASSKKVHGAIEKNIDYVSVVLDDNGNLTNEYSTMARIRLFKSGVYQRT